MPKFEKEKKKALKVKKKEKTEEIFAYNSVIVSLVIVGVFILVSLLFNCGIITIFMKDDIFFIIIDVSIKAGAIILFYLFGLISLGNYKDITGKPVDWKDFLLLFLIALLQSIRNPLVFIFSFLGLIAVTIYLNLVQDK